MTLNGDQNERLAALEAAVEIYRRADETFSPWEAVALAEYIRTGSTSESARASQQVWFRPPETPKEDGSLLVAGPALKD